MVRRESQPHRDARAKLADFLELKTADLDGHHIERAAFENLRGKSRADVSAGDGLDPGGVEHPGDQLGRGGLSVGAGDAHHGPSAKLIGEFEFPDQLDALGTEIFHQRHHGIDARAEYSEIIMAAVDIRRGARNEGDAQSAERVVFCRELHRIAAVEHGDERAEFAQQLRRALAAFARPEDRDMEAGDVHRSFKVASPRSAQMKLTIQKRVTTAVSFQPLNSK
jgi:hypothetical protein